MTDKRIKYFKLNRINKRKFLILSILILIFILIPFSKNFELNHLYTQNNIKDKDFQIENLKTQDLTTDNTFSSVGAPWNVSHWANRTDYNIPVGFGNGTSDTKNMNLGVGWEGYKLNGTIKELYDKRNWVNGTFEAGDDDNDPSSGDNDDYKLINWSFYENDVTTDFNNDFSGNYFDSASAPSGVSSNCMELRMDGDAGNSYDKFDKCWWETIFTLPRGNIIEGEISLVMYPWTQYNPQGGGTGEYGTHWSIQIIINGVLIDDKNLIWIEITGINSWAPLKLQLTNWLDNPTVFPTGVKNMNLTIQLIRNGGSLGYPDYGPYQQVLIDNVTFSVKAQVNATQIGLQMNEQPVSNIDWGNGTVEQINTWTTTPVDVKFNSTEVRPSEMGGYDVEFKTNLNLFAKKMSTDSHYQPNFLGTTFEVSNGSSVKWESYARVSVPTGFEETDMTIRFPEDVNITWISNAEYPDTNILKYSDNSTLGILKVSNFSETPDGFWWVKGVSPNYCSDLNIYNNATGPWVLNNTFLSGDYINITGKIVSPQIDISGYIKNTQARLYIRFPNGTIWATENQIKLVNNSGIVYFDPILIPNVDPNYEAGEYEAIITWNNSYSFFELNETGIIYKKFTVIHDSTLQPDQDIYFIENIVDDRVINIKVSYNDIIDNTAIENALVYTNFSGQIQYFSEISPGFYLFELNATKAGAGNNTLTIHANSTYYLNKVINITVEVIKETLLTVENDFFTVPWKQNFTVRFNYTEKNNPTIGINSTDISIDWLGDYYLTQTIEGQYVLTCNTSTYDALTLQSFIISVNKYKYESQSILIRVQITEVESSLKLFVNGDLVNSSDTVQIALIDTLNFTVYYRDKITTAHLSNATINILGVGILNETNNQYTINIDAIDLGQGITALTVFAQLANYQSQSINIFIEVFERETELILFLNNIPKNDGDTIQVELGESINVTIYYRDNVNKTHLTNASVVLVGSISGTLDEINNQYNISIDAQDLDQGITILTIFGQLSNYQSQSIQFFVEVVERSTDLKLFLNIEEKTFDPVYSLTKGQSLNLTIKYIDNQTGQHINTGIVQLIGEGLLLDLTRDNILGQYYIVLDTTTLGIGVKLFTIVAQATNYQIKTIDPRITVNRISATINTENGISQIEVDVGENVLLQVVLNDTIFGGTITNATVTYRWAYGQGELVDSNNDSIYEATLPNVQSGVDDITVYHITITAFAGDDYNFESFEITLIVSQPTTQPGTDLSWLVFVLIGAILGLVTIFIFYQTYFKYPPLVRKMRKLKKRIKKGKKAKPIIVSSREEISNKNFEDQKKVLELEIVQHQPDKIKKLNKNSIKKEEEM